MMNRWRKWWALSWADRLLLLHAALLLLQARSRLPSTEFRPEADPDPSEPDPAVAQPAITRAQQVARVVGMAATGTPGTITCLHRSLVTWRLLRREGIPCQLRLGASESRPQFEAHAWVECHGVALGEQDAHLARYSAFGKAVIPSGWYP